jgi:Protein of unknown function (DUF3037)
MAMPKLGFLLVQYFPNAVSDQFINIGVVLVDSDHAGFLAVRFRQDWRSVQSFDPEADIEVLESFAAEMRRTKDRPALLHTMEDSFSNAIRLSPRKDCQTDNPLAEIEALTSQYLGKAVWA